ncbi:MAG: cytochrome c peroxidase, partial [Patescibacteria group bacterium]
MKTKFQLLLIAALFFTISSCVKEGVDVEYNYYDEEGYVEMKKVLNLPETPMAYHNEYPSYYINSSSFSFNRDLATLGRVIFYDKALSSDGTISCASCHDQAAAFADNKQFSDGVDGKVTARNSLALGSVFSFQEYYGSIISNRVPFFWDNRANNVEDQSRETFANDREMNMEMHDVVNAMNNQPYYRPLLKVIRGSEVADEYTALEAVSVFVNSISSYNSLYDDALSEYFDENQNLDNIRTAELPLFSPIENQ